VERTFLAWLRTGIALMGFGFVVARFGLFLREIAAARRRSNCLMQVFHCPQASCSLLLASLSTSLRPFATIASSGQLTGDNSGRRLGQLLAVACRIARDDWTGRGCLFATL